MGGKVEGVAPPARREEGKERRWGLRAPKGENEGRLPILPKRVTRTYLGFGSLIEPM